MKFVVTALLLSSLPIWTHAEEICAADSKESMISEAEIRTAVERAIPHLERGSRDSANQRACFTCHNQAVPVFALTAANDRGFAIDQENLLRQVKHTWQHLKKNEVRYSDGRGQGGQVMTAGYALWTLDEVDHKSDSVTQAVAHYLSVHHQDKGHWSGSKGRPPTSGSDFTATYVALRGMQNFGGEADQAEIQERIRKAAEAIAKVKTIDTEDRVFRLALLPYIDASDEEVQAAVEILLTTQSENGGWAQKSEMQPDAYATATVIWALQEYGNLPDDNPAIVKGVQYLLRTQLKDGTWRVRTRAKPIQDYFESGFPHGEDQFISIAATGWATLVLVNRLPVIQEGS